MPCDYEISYFISIIITITIDYCSNRKSLLNFGAVNMDEQEGPGLLKFSRLQKLLFTYIDYITYFHDSVLDCLSFVVI